MAKSYSIGLVPGLVIAGLAVYGFIGFATGSIGNVVIAVILATVILAIAEGKTKSNPESKKSKKSKNITAQKKRPIAKGSQGTSVGRHVTVEEADYAISRRNDQVVSCVFHRKGASVEIQGFTIDGLIYTGKRRRDSYRESAIIDPSMPIERTELADPLGYCPDYGMLSPGQRGLYLAWLANGRGQTDELGYVFLYFYGFERYVYRDAAQDTVDIRNTTLKHIADEITRLRRIFAHNRSFEGYSSNLLDAIYVRFWPERVEERKKGLPTRMPIAASYAIIRQANEAREQPLDADWALQWVLGYGGVSRTKAVRENYPLIRAMFRPAYESATQGGIVIPTCKRRAGQLNFPHAAQGLDDVACHQFSAAWFSPLELKRPQTQLEVIFGEVMPVVRKLSKALATKQLLEILSAWPADVPMDASPQLTSIVNSLQSFLSKRETLSATEMGRLFQLPKDTKLTSTLCRKIASAMETCGFTLVPDPLISPVTLKPDDALCLYNGERLSALSPEAERLSTAIRLGSILALADGELHEHEVAILRKRVELHAHEAERQYLHKYIDWNLTQSPSAAGLKRQIDQLKGNERHELADLLVEVAQADGALPKAEIRELEKLFSRLGLDTTGVTEKLHGAAVSQISGIATTVKPVSSPDSSSGVDIDLDVLEAHANATREVQSVLSKIFEEEEPEEPLSSDTGDPGPSSDAWHEGHLDGNHDALATWLLTGDEWSMAEVTLKCTELGLMPEGALTAINEAAFETLGDSLIDMGDPVEVYRDVLPV